MALLQLVTLSALFLQTCWARPGYPGAHNGAFNGGYNGAYNGAFNGGYNPAYDGASFDPHPRYNFDYRVSEPRTGDFKNHQESRDGDAVRGSYSVAEPDGSLLTVRYAADDAHGYTAVVERSGAGGTVVQNFPGPAPLPVGPVGPAAPYVAPVAPVAAHYGAPHGAGLNHGGPRPGAPFGYNGGYNGGYPGGPGGFGTSTTSFHGPHAAYSYSN